MEQDVVSAEPLAISQLPKFLRQRIKIPENVKAKHALDTTLIGVLTEFFAVERLQLNHEAVILELEDVREWRADMVLAKLRALLEKQARRDIGEYCRALTKERRGNITKALHQAGIHHFRENIETDLYVGIHTAISANFKMMGVVYSDQSIPLQLRNSALDQLFRALQAVAAQPLGVLFALEGLFWDRGVYALPRGITWRDDGIEGTFYLDLLDLDQRLSTADINEVPTGCPAMRTRTSLGELSLIHI